MVGFDGKVFSSLLRTLETERVDKATGELRPVRQDTARQRYGEGGVEGLVWGTKFAIASVRSRLANHRVILGLAHFDSATTGGEGRVFTDLALDLARRSTGLHAYTADGAWRGTHLNQIQTATGCGVIAPARRRTERRGGILIDGSDTQHNPFRGAADAFIAKRLAAGTNSGPRPAPCSSRSSPPRGRPSTVS